VWVRADRQMSILPLVFGLPGHNTWESEESSCPHRDWLDDPDQVGDVE
jgi:hypothetical protein